MELVPKGWWIGRGMVRREAVMATKFEKPLEASQVTHVADMPPLEVVTEGIPAQEHIEAPPTAQPEAAPVTPERRRHTLAWALAGAIGFLLVVAGIFAFTQNSPTSTPDLHMGLTPQAWQEFRAGERASTTPFHMGLTLPRMAEPTGQASGPWPGPDPHGPDPAGVAGVPCWRAGVDDAVPHGSQCRRVAGLPVRRTGRMTQARQWSRVTPRRSGALRHGGSTRPRSPSARCAQLSAAPPGRQPSAGAG